MDRNGKKIVIIGGGIAGLCAAVYGQKCGYQTVVLEMHEIPGGLATSWRRSGYTFETCLHWLLGSKPGSDFNAIWHEVCDIDQLTFINPIEFVRMENEHGEALSIWTNPDRLEQELLARSPRDTAEIRRLTHAIRTLAKFRMPAPGAGFFTRWLTYLHDIPCFPLLRRYANISCSTYGRRFAHPLIRSFFGEGEMGQLSAIALVFSLAWMASGDAGYSIGGAQALIHLIQRKLSSLGGELRCGAKAEQILVENGTAVGVRLASGETIMADWVISAADGHAAIYDLLGGKYTSSAIGKIYNEMQTFPSYLQVSLGVAHDLSDQPAMATRVLDTPLRVDPETEQTHLGFRFFHYDPTFAPPGRTAVTAFLATRNYRYWVDLRQNDPDVYSAEKHRVAEAVIDVLERRIPGIRAAVETIDVSTPATVIRYTGNWKGSMEGWFMPPGGSFRPLPNTLPGLQQFMMVGQWISPGGGLPSGPMSARPAIRAICKKDRVPFLPAEPRAKDVRHWRLRTP